MSPFQHFETIDMQSSALQKLADLSTSSSINHSWNPFTSLSVVGMSRDFKAVSQLWLALSPSHMPTLARPTRNSKDHPQPSELLSSSHPSTVTQRTDLQSTKW